MSRFETTRWKLILASGWEANQGRGSLQALCCAYRALVLAYLRQMVDRDEDAEELLDFRIRPCVSTAHVIAIAEMPIRALVELIVQIEVFWPVVLRSDESFWSIKP